MSGKARRRSHRGAGGFSILMAVALSALALPSAAAAQAPPPVLYAATGQDTPSQLYTVDPQTGATTAVGPIGFAVTGLAVDPTTAILYGATTPLDPTQPETLITVDRATGAGTVVGSFGHIVADMDFNSAGELFGWSENVDDLVSIDKATGAATVVGNSGRSTRGSGMSFDIQDVLYILPNNDNGPYFTVDTATGGLTQVGTLSNGPPPAASPIPGASFACDRRTFYAVDNNFGSTPVDLITVDVASGVISTVGSTGVLGLDALVWDCPTRFELAPGSVTVNEDAGTITFTVNRLGGMKGQVSVNFATADGSATAGSDYGATSGTLTFANNETSKTVTIPILNDTADEPNETFTVNLSGATGGASTGPAAQVTITDNDVAGLLPGACANQRLGSAGRDVLDGSAAGDTLRGLAGNDRLTGFAGRDCLFGGRGGDQLRGGNDSDRLSGGRGGDRLFGGQGGDRIDPGRGNDRVAAGRGDDHVRARGWELDTIDCGPGANDVAIVDRLDQTRRCEQVRRP